jgi:hypothetical protein
MFVPFHVLWLRDANSYLPWCTSTVCRNMGVFIDKAATTPASLAVYSFIDACASMICCGEFVGLHAVHSNPNRLRAPFSCLLS